MSNSLFVIAFILLSGAMYLYSIKKWKKREQEFDEFAYEMQRDFAAKTVSINTAIDFYEQVRAFYEEQSYTLTKHPDFSTDFIAKKDKEILFLRVQGPENKEFISAKLFQAFIGQTVMYALNNPVYQAYTLKWAYVCSKMKLDKSARIYINKYKDKLKFELIEAA